MNRRVKKTWNRIRKKIASRRFRSFAAIIFGTLLTFALYQNCGMNGTTSQSLLGVSPTPASTPLSPEPILSSDVVSYAFPYVGANNLLVTVSNSGGGYAYQLQVYEQWSGNTFQIVADSCSGGVLATNQVCTFEIAYIATSANGAGGLVKVSALDSHGASIYLQQNILLTTPAAGGSVTATPTPTPAPVTSALLYGSAHSTAECQAAGGTTVQVTFNGTSNLVCRKSVSATPITNVTSLVDMENNISDDATTACGQMSPLLVGGIPLVEYSAGNISVYEPDALCGTNAYGDAIVKSATATAKATVPGAPPAALVASYYYGSLQYNYGYSTRTCGPKTCCDMSHVSVTTIYFTEPTAYGCY